MSSFINDNSDWSIGILLLRIQEKTLHAVKKHKQMCNKKERGKSSTCYRKISWLGISNQNQYTCFDVKYLNKSLQRSIAIQEIRINYGSMILAVHKYCQNLT